MELDYGQEVLYKPQDGKSAPAKCAIVSMTPIETARQAEAFGYPRGFVMYTVEFADGTDKIVPQTDLFIS